MFINLANNFEALLNIKSGTMISIEKIEAIKVRYNKVKETIMIRVYGSSLEYFISSAGLYSFNQSNLQLSKLIKEEVNKIIIAAIVIALRNTILLNNLNIKVNNSLTY